MKLNPIVAVAGAATLITGGIVLIINSRRAKQKRQVIMDNGIAAVKSIMAEHPNSQAVQAVGKEAIAAMHGR